MDAFRRHQKSRYGPKGTDCEGRYCYASTTKPIERRRARRLVKRADLRDDHEDDAWWWLDAEEYWADPLRERMLWWGVREGSWDIRECDRGDP